MKITQSTLKIIAMCTMLIDHIGELLFPDVIILRIVGRLAFPIFAYLIAEGCKHTHNKPKYLMRILLCAGAYQLVHVLIHKNITPCVVWAYAAAVGFTMLIDWAKKDWNKLCLVPTMYAIVACIVLLITKTDYWFYSFLLVAIIYLIQKPWLKWLCFAAVLILASAGWLTQLWSLCIIPLLMLYKGDRGKLKLGHTMYYFYPLHYLILGVIQYFI